MSGKKSGKSAKRVGGENHRRRKPTESYRTYIYRVLKQVHPDTGITKLGMSVVNSFMQDIFDRLASQASELASKAGKKTLTACELQAAVRFVMPGELAKHSVSEGTKAVTKYTEGKGVVCKTKKEKSSSS